MNKELVMRSAIASLLAAGLSAGAGQALAGDEHGKKMEKCAGIVKAGKNDCGTATSSCAGTAKADAEPDTWIYLPKGTCEKIVGGTVVASKK
jgi:uncharacterized membrane protein